MSYQEKKSLLSMVTSVVLFGSYCLIIFTRYGDRLFGADADFRIWGAAFLILIPLSIVVNIIAHIIFVIIYYITTREEVPSISDERDKLIELKATRNSHYSFITGFLIAMGSLAFGLHVTGAFAILILLGFFSSLVSDITSFLYYRRGF